MTDASDDVFSREAPPADRRIFYGPDGNQFGDLRLPAGLGPFPLVIAIHGGYWRARYDLEYLGHLCAALTRRGVATWNIEYRRLGQLGGGWPGTFEDVARAADFARDLARLVPVDLSRAVSLGHSAGGHLALWLAARPRIPRTSVLYMPHPLQLRAAVSLAGVSDLELAAELRLSHDAAVALLAGTPADHPERVRAASIPRLLPLGVPQLLAHGEADDSVPLVISERHAARARQLGDDVHVLRFAGAGHFELVDPSTPQWQVVEDAVMALLAH